MMQVIAQLDTKQSADSVRPDGVSPASAAATLAAATATKAGRPGAGLGAFARILSARLGKAGKADPAIMVFARQLFAKKITADLARVRLAAKAGEDQPRSLNTQLREILGQTDPSVTTKGMELEGVLEALGIASESEESAETVGALLIAEKLIETLAGFQASTGAVTADPPADGTSSAPSMRVLQQPGSAVTEGLAQISEPPTGDAVNRQPEVAARLVRSDAEAPTPLNVVDMRSEGPATDGESHSSASPLAQSVVSDQRGAERGAEGPAPRIAVEVTRIPPRDTKQPSSDQEQQSRPGDGRQNGLWTNTTTISAASSHGRSRSDPASQGVQTRGLPSAAVIESLRESLQSTFVRRNGIILRDEGNGEIRLVLKPESLGSVRVKVNIVENRIEGRIIVENNSVREIIESNMENMRRAFLADGFDSSSIEVWVGGDRQRHQRRNSEPEDQVSTVQASEAIEQIEKTIPSLDPAGVEELLVDLVV